MRTHNSEDRKKRAPRLSLAALSVIALTGTSLAAVPSFMAASPASAAELSGGIRDKIGAVEKDAQKASDLPAGSCVVSGKTPEGNQAGFTWYTSEPSTTSPDKKSWGLSVAFDNSKDRTFADWSFTNSGLMGAFLDAAQIPATNAGQTFGGKEVTHKADEELDITASQRQRNLNIYAELTDAKVKQFAEATATNPVRYAWQGNYKTDRTSSPYATQGDSASFTAVVNPWPSENIECNPITVSWENFEKHVIVAGAETKVGKINVPAVKNGGTDDSMSRMVVEAYDGNGAFIGTTDPAVSGGTKNLRIADNGDIYFTWPEYRGTDLATDKNVNFSVLAKPRTVDQLQAAGENNNEFGNTQVFNNSNSLTRYNKANVIDSKSFSLDDTEYHSPKYDKTDATIISGVDSPTGPLATEPQKVTFTQTPDLIKELAKKKADGGFDAKVTLDEKYVYEGWTVEMDENYNVTVTAPENPRPGTFARPVITVEYSNGSTDKLELLVVVDPNNTQVTDLVRPSLTKGHIGDDLTAQVGTKSIMKGYKPVHPAKFEIDESTVPAGWTVTVDDTGKVTAKADDTVAPGTIITPKVKATYPDQTTDEIEVQFQAIVDIKIPTYDTVTNKPAAKVSLKPEIPERGLSGNTTDEAPKRYTFPEGKTEYTHTDDSGTWTVMIDENTGEITTTIPRTAPEGYILNVPVLAYYNNADKPQEVKGTVVVLKSDFSPTYSVESTGPNQAVNHQVQDAPKGSKFSFGKDENDQPILEQEVDGWKYTIDPNTGVVSSTPPADSKPGDKKTINVTVTTPEGSTPLVPVTTVVKLTNNWEAEPSYPVQTVYPGETATLPIALDKPDTVNVAKENPYKLGDVPAGWNVSIDDNGQVTATAPADAKPGDQVKIPVTVTYEDGSTDTTYAVVNVLGVPEREVPFQVEYKYDDSIPAGEYKVETKGKPGKEKMKKDGTWERSEEPQNEVVVIGTKPAESAKEVTWKVPIPYPTEVRENPDLKPGETRVVQEGENGEKTFTAKFTASGDQAEVVEEETTKEPVKRIVEYGPGIAPSELVTKTEKPIPFETKVIFDDTLEAGQQVVDQKGEVGTEVETSTQKLVDGKPSGDPVVTSERTKEPTEQIIRVGTKTSGTITETVKSEVPFGVKIEFDPNMPAGTSEVVTEGVPGEKTVTITREIVNSKPGDPQITEEITKQPVDQVIKVGTKPSQASSTVTWTAQVPFEVITRPNPELKPGEIKVVQKGVPGEKTYTADFSATGDQATVTPEEKQTKDPVDEIIEYGPAAEDTEVVTKVEKPVPFETEIVFDDTLEKGKQVVDQEGELGTEVVTSTQKIKDGKLDGDPEVTTERTKEPTKRIIRVGTYDPAPSVEPKQVELPYTTKIVYDKNLEPGQEVVDQEGENGLIEVTVKDGQPEVKTVKEPVERIVRVGTKPAEGVEWTEEIAFEVKVVEDPELEAGKVETVQQGKPGERVHKTDGTEEVRVKPVDHIIKVGTKCNCDQPTPEPSEDPTPDPSEEPTPEPSEDPTPDPSEEPTPDPSEEPTPEPSEDPTPEPSEDPTPEPSEDPTPEPSEDPTPEPSEEPTPAPSEDPAPSEEPSEDPSEDPTPAPSEEPTTDPTEDPTGEPGESPSESPSAPGANNNKPAQPQKPGTPPLARTGVNAGGALATVALMMLGGVGLLALRRRPSQR
ncbi:G5 domain-containing protein [Pseudoglutamicibacter cumminsii]|uniref:G5 domain-containing protein n=1 Tax=Pseudoglutamicibacter cumminsii TaxID=156979 RepID=UPI0021A9636E|nr:G5 domain-containing protein [Pseudoglutamicibacter cumminsii]MCT1686608.1 G5 domain-containing protein [Pseudoglutamicibacter cumminsii]